SRRPPDEASAKGRPLHGAGDGDEPSVEREPAPRRLSERLRRRALVPGDVLGQEPRVTRVLHERVDPVGALADALEAERLVREERRPGPAELRVVDDAGL